MAGGRQHEKFLNGQILTTFLRITMKLASWRTVKNQSMLIKIQRKWKMCEVSAYPTHKNNVVKCTPSWKNLILRFVFELLLPLLVSMGDVKDDM